ncbi:MAG: polyprenyl synthetase family protein [Chthoniobacteraceae bacterium]|nr:polyprenyl synthetase family protein [Chthoniobacteraceae bacterium]
METAAKPSQASPFPPTAKERRQLRDAVESAADALSLVPPVPLEDLRAHAETIRAALGCPAAWSDNILLLLNNALWRDAFAAVPFERRLLLLPKCLRPEASCPAGFDALGLRCERCGACALDGLQAEAERLGYAVLIAEGSAVVMALIAAKKVEAILGVSCLGVLERAFAPMAAAAIPGIAIPLLRDGCRDTDVDLDAVRDALRLRAEPRAPRIDLDALRAEVASWFTQESLDALAGPAEGRTEAIAREWLARGGNRWRPLLCASAYRALHHGGGAAAFPDSLRKIALAVECFHKASLIHDDIEDGDAERSGTPALHAEHGLAAALNAGDLLIGEGYRLLAECGLPAEQRAAMLGVAAEGQRQLCRGQGEELLWARNPEPLTQDRVLNIFQQKTAPAFEVALHLGALAAGRDPHAAIAGALSAYSRALGVAYQIQDDLADAARDAAKQHPSLFPALSRDEAQRLLDARKTAAVRALAALENPALKGLLRRIIGKIFNETELTVWCREAEQNKA